eukprot:3941991-Rhodomonas_salina.3
MAEVSAKEVRRTVAGRWYHVTRSVLDVAWECRHPGLGSRHPGSTIPYLSTMLQYHIIMQLSSMLCSFVPCYASRPVPYRTVPQYHAIQQVSTIPYSSTVPDIA